MKSFSVAIPFTMTVLLVVVLFLAPSTSAITCSDVIGDLRPCLGYLTSSGGNPPAPCCAGVKSLASAATTTADKQTACNCIKTAAKSVKVNPAVAKALPANCKVSLPYTVSPTVDCTKIT